MAPSARLPPASAEMLLLARLVRSTSVRDVGAAALGQASTLAAIDWSLLLDLAARHRVLPALAEGVRCQDLPVPDDVRAELTRVARHAVLAELVLAAMVKDILIAAEQRGVTLLLLKGVALSQMLHGRLGLRTSRDIDLLVAPAQTGDALQLLASLGFRHVDGGEIRASDGIAARTARGKDIELIHAERQVIVELHWRLFDNPCLMPLPAPLPMQMIALSGGMQAPTLPGDLALLYLANHGCQHGWSRLKWLADFANLADHLAPGDLDRLHATTPIKSGRRALSQALLLCAALFDRPVPPSVQAAAKERRVRLMLSLAWHCLVGTGAVELESLRFGSTRKNLSHYLLRGDPAYLAAELRFDVAPPNVAPVRFGAAGRLWSWMARHGPK